MGTPASLGSEDKMGRRISQPYDYKHVFGSGVQGVVGVAGQPVLVNEAASSNASMMSRERAQEAERAEAIAAREALKAPRSPVFKSIARKRVPVMLDFKDIEGLCENGLGVMAYPTPIEETSNPLEQEVVNDDEDDDVLSPAQVYAMAHSGDCKFLAERDVPLLPVIDGLWTSSCNADSFPLPPRTRSMPTSRLGSPRSPFAAFSSKHRTTNSFNTPRGISISPTSAARSAFSSFCLPPIELPYLPTLFPQGSSACTSPATSFASTFQTCDTNHDLVSSSDDCLLPTSAQLRSTSSSTGSSSGRSSTMDPIMLSPRMSMVRVQADNNKMVFIDVARSSSLGSSSISSPKLGQGETKWGRPGSLEEDEEVLEIKMASPSC